MGALSLDARLWRPEKLLAITRHGVEDLRELFTNDIRFLEQF